MAPNRGRAAIVIAHNGSNKNCSGKANHFWKRCERINDRAPIAPMATGNENQPKGTAQDSWLKIFLASVEHMALNSPINHER